MPSLLKPCTSWDYLPDWRYGDDHPDQVIDLWDPKGNSSTTNPLIVWVHGGGYWGGDESTNWMPFDPLYFVRKGFAVASVRYRLSTAANWPAQIQDVLAAMRELRVRAPGWRIYPAKFGLWGASAGGHLAALAGVASADTDFRAGNWPNTGHAPAVVLADYPPTSIQAWATAPGVSPDPNPMLTELFGAPVSALPAVADAASPALQVTPQAVPLALRHGTGDVTVPISQSEALRVAYLAQGAAVSLTTKAGYGHADGRFYGSTELLGIANLFDAYLRPA